MNFIRRLLPVLAVSAAAIADAQTPLAPGPLNGRVQGHTYVAPEGLFRVPLPVLAELGGRITDTANSVTFIDDFNYVFTIAWVEISPERKRELETGSMREFLTTFFANQVMPDFQAAFRGAQAESARYAPGIYDGALLVYTLLPGGSMFSHKLTFVSPNETIPDAKRGNLVVVREGYIFILSTEIVERVLERRTYSLTKEEENDILRRRLVEMLGKMEFAPKPDQGDTPPPPTP